MNPLLLELNKVFFNSTRSLDVLYVMRGIKKTARLDAADHEIKGIYSFCETHGLHCETSDFKVAKIADEGKNNFSNKAKRVSAAYPGRGLFHLYIAKKKAACSFLKLLEHKNDDRAVGELLGYPGCCIDFFLQHQKNQELEQYDFILPALANSEGFTFPFYNNYAIRYFDISLLSHFPHDFICKESRKIAEKRLQCIDELDPLLAEKCKEMLKGAVLYTEHNGVFMLRNPVLENNAVSFSKVMATADNELLRTLKATMSITVEDSRGVYLNDQRIPRSGFMLFQ